MSSALGPRTLLRAEGLAVLAGALVL